MLNPEISRIVLNQSSGIRIELARLLVKSAVEPGLPIDAVKNGLQRIEDVATGTIAGLTEEQYRAAMR